jgi:hypothetical protein
MKKIILAVVLTLFAGQVVAQHGYRGGYNHGRSATVNNYGHHSGHRGGGWSGGAIGAAIIGGAIVGAVIAAPYYSAPPIYDAPPVVYGTYQPPVSVPYGYRQEEIIDASCNCVRRVLVPNQ